MIVPGREKFERDFRRKHAEWLARLRPWPRRRVRPATIPAATLASLERIFGAAAADVRVIEYSRHWTFWHPRFTATTRRGRILLRGSVEEFLRDPALVLEEYFHVLRQWDTGALTRWRYLLQAARRGYARNRYEVEAKRFARERSTSYRAPV